MAFPNLWPTNDEVFPKNNKLGLWCKNQKKRKESLEKWKIDHFNQICFPWFVVEGRMV